MHRLNLDLYCLYARDSFDTFVSTTEFVHTFILLNIAKRGLSIFYVSSVAKCRMEMSYLMVSQLKIGSDALECASCAPSAESAPRSFL